APAPRKQATSGGAPPARRNQAAPGLAPVTAAHRSVASRRASAVTGASRSTARSSSPAMVSCCAGSSTEAFLFSRELQRVDELVQLAVQHGLEVVNGVVDAMIGDAVLRKVVGPDLGRAVAGADHGAAVARPRRLLLGEHAIEQPRPQDLERLDLVLE